MIHIADLHLGLSSDSLDIDGIPSKVVWSFERLHFLLSVAKQQKDKSVLIAGDIFDSPDPPSYVISLFLRWLSEAEEASVNIALIPGNHDYGFQWSATSVIDFSGYRNVSVFEGIGIAHIANSTVLFLPHFGKVQLGEIARRGGIQKALSEFFILNKRKEKVDLIICHGQPSVQFDEGSEARIEAGNAMVLDPVILSKFGKYIFMGHVHRHQQINHLYIPGSIITNDFAEVGDHKGYYVYDGKKPPQFIRFPKSNKWEYCHLDLDLRHRGDLPSPKELKEMLSGNMVKVRVKAKDRLQVERKKIVALVESLGAHVFRFEVEVPQRKKSSEETLAEEEVYQGGNYASLFFEYMKKQKMKTVDRNLAVKLGKEIIASCLKR